MHSTDLPPIVNTLADRAEPLPMITTVHAVVIGAGMAGLSAAAELARDRSVTVLEAETAPAQHTTGRSAAEYIERYGGPAIAPFNLASFPWFMSAGEGAVDHPLLHPRGMIVLEPTFVWCVGQGGIGIQASPAAARALVSLVDRGGLPEDVAALGGDAAAVTPGSAREGG